MNRKNNAVLGVIFIILGLLFLMKNTGIFNIYFDIFDIGFIISRFWPVLFLILPGVLIHAAYFTGKNRDAGSLVPGGILLFTGLTCQLSYTFGMWGALWPGFIMAVAIGLFELYLFGSRDKGILIPVFILGGTSIVFFFQFTFDFSLRNYIYPLIVPAILIAIGVSVILKGREGGGKFK